MNIWGIDSCLLVALPALVLLPKNFFVNIIRLHFTSFTTSVHQHINISLHQNINNSTHKHINTSKHKHIKTSIHRHIKPSTHQYIDNILTKEMMAARRRILTSRSSNCSKTSSHRDLPGCTTILGHVHVRQL